MCLGAIGGLEPLSFLSTYKKANWLCGDKTSLTQGTYRTLPLEMNKHKMEEEAELVYAPNWELEDLYKRLFYLSRARECIQQCQGTRKEAIVLSGLWDHTVERITLLEKDAALLTADER